MLSWFSPSLSMSVDHTCFNSLLSSLYFALRSILVSLGFSSWLFTNLSSLLVLSLFVFVFVYFAFGSFVQKGEKAYGFLVVYWLCFVGVSNICIKDAKGGDWKSKYLLATFMLQHDWFHGHVITCDQIFDLNRFFL